MHGYRQTSSTANSTATNFNATVRGNKGIKRKSIVALVRSRDGTNLQQYRNKMYRTNDAVFNDMGGEWKSSFLLLAPHLAEFQRVNLDSTLALDVDQHNRYFRFVAAFGVAVDNHPFNVPVVDFDGTHSRHGKYIGGILSLIGQDGIRQMSSLHQHLFTWKTRTTLHGFSFSVSTLESIS